MENLIFYLTIFLTFALILNLIVIKKIKLTASDKITFAIAFSVFVATFGGSIVFSGTISAIRVLSFTSGLSAIISVICAIRVLKVVSERLDSIQNKKIKKNYPKLSIIGIMRERKGNQKFQTIYLLLIVTIIYIFAGKFVNFATSDIFLVVLLGSVLLIALESLIFNYRVNKGWYGSSESEAREIIDFIIKNSEDINFTDGNSPKSIIKPEDIQQVVEELGIQIPGYPEPNVINKGFSEG